MQGKTGHAASQRGQTSCGIRRAEFFQQALGSFDCGIGWGIEPGQVENPPDTHGLHLEDKAGQFAAQNFGLLVLRAAREVLDRIETNRATSADAAGPAGPLYGRSFADAGDFEHRQPGGG